MNTKQGHMSDVDQMLEKTELGHTVNKNRNILIGVAIVVVVAVSGYAFWKVQSNKEMTNELNAIYEFNQNFLTPFKAQKKNWEEVAAQLDQLKKQAGGNPAITTVLIDTAVALREKGMLDVATAQLESSFSLLKSNPYGHYIMATNLAVVYEENKQYEKAIALLEELTNSHAKIYEARIYLDLGRIYQLSGNSQKAQMNFEYLLKNYPQDPLAQMAQVYLDRLPSN